MSGSNKIPNPRDNSFQFTCTHDEAVSIIVAHKRRQQLARSMTMSGFLRDVVMNGVESSESEVST